ncbi:MAG: hypothetical protein HPY57_10060 [Ignavibacteria bacterium]|nr:hypothetical protein [Ignavibacteria bacterium]
MFRLIFFLFLMYLVYKALRFFYRIFIGINNSQNISREKREVIDIDYEEVKEDKKSSE